MKSKKRRKQPWEKAQHTKYKDKPRRLREWYQEVSRITIQPSFGDAFQFELHAFGVGMPQEVLKVSIVGAPESLFEFSMDRRAMKELAIWFVKAMYLLDSLREWKEWQIQNAKRKPAEMHDRSCHLKWSKKSASK